MKINRDKLRIITILSSRAKTTSEETTTATPKIEKPETKEIEIEGKANQIEKVEQLHKMITEMIEKLTKNPDKFEELLKEFGSKIAPLNVEMSKTGSYVNYKQLLDNTQNKTTITLGAESFLKQLETYEKLFKSDIENLKL